MTGAVDVVVDVAGVYVVVDVVIDEAGINIVVDVAASMWWSMCHESTWHGSTRVVLAGIDVAWQ